MTRKSLHKFSLQKPKGNSLQTICLVVLLGLSCAVALGGQVDDKDPDWFMKLPVYRDLRAKFVLFSWTTQNDLRRFAIISDRDGTQGHRFVDKFDARHTPGMSKLELEERLAKLPRGCLVHWMRDKPHKLDHANHEIVCRLKKLAQRLKIDLQLDSYRYEDSGV